MPVILFLPLLLFSFLFGCIAISEKYYKLGSILFSIFVTSIIWAFLFSCQPWKVDTITATVHTINNTDVVSFEYNDEMHIINLNEKTGRDWTQDELIEIHIQNTNRTYVGVLPFLGVNIESIKRKKF